MVKAHGIKLKCYWEHHGGTTWEFEEPFGTFWELDGCGNIGRKIPSYPHNPKK
jgi:hypothetical protein